MEYYSSKICKKCYSAQEPAAHFCDNCGKPFAATAATDGNISIITKTFLKRQVTETRPLFWLGIIIVGMLGVFGFAQAGMYLVSPSASGVEIAKKPTNLVSRENVDPTRSQTAVPASDVTATPPNDALDLNNSVFEMRDAGSASTPRLPGKRRHSTTNAKSSVEPTKSDSVSTEQSTKAETNAASDWVPEAKKPAEPSSTTKKYIRGPMGGCFYLSPSGSKRYVDRGLCS